MGGNLNSTSFSNGYFLRFTKKDILFEIRLTHKSSGGHQYKSPEHNFRVKANEHYLTGAGVQGDKAKTHFKFTACPSDRIHSIIEKHLKWRKYKNK